MDIKGFDGMGIWTEGFTACDYIYAETCGDYLAARITLSLLAMPGCVQQALQNSTIA